MDRNCMSCIHKKTVTEVSTGKTSYRCRRNGFRVNRRMWCEEWSDKTVESTLVGAFSVRDMTTEKKR